MKVYISIGSNLNDRIKNIKMAINEISKIMKLKRISPIYETSPIGITEQPYFLNCVIESETDTLPEELLKSLKMIEKKIGRKNRKKWDKREIDLDILLYGDMIYKSKSLVIPHREMKNRKFVLIPLCDLIPDFIHPVHKKTLKQMLEDIKDDKQIVKKFCNFSNIFVTLNVG